MAVQISGNDITVPRDGSFTRNVTIGGTLTYEDVTNIDSVGLVTARTGIEIGARPGVAASISVDGNMIVSGISTFGGDVQVPDKIIHSGDTNTAIRFPAADTITAETGGSERLRIDSSGRLLLGLTSDSRTTSMIISGNTSGATSFGVLNIDIGTTSVSADTNLGIIRFGATGDRRGADIRGMGEGTWSAGSSHPSRLSFYTCAASASSPTEKLRLDSSGRLLLGTTTEGESSADNLTIADSGNTGITIRSGTSNYGLIYFSDATSGTGEYDGAIEYKHSDNFMVFRTGASERLRIDSSGHMGLGVTPNSNWPSNDDFKALQIGTGACVFGRGSGDDDRAGLAANYYATGSGNAYLANGHANLIYLNDGNINCYTAPQNSSGAGAAMSLVEVLSVNTNGYVTKPKNLCLSYTASSSLNYTSSGTLIYATEVFDVGDSNAYNTSTGVFTAPITGIYNIYHEYYNVTGYNAMTKLEKSTNSGSSFSQIKIFGRQRNDDAYTSAGFSHLVQANANDQFKITWYDGQVHINNTFTHMHIQLVQ